MRLSLHAYLSCLPNWGLCTQDIYGKIIGKCASVHSLRWQVLDPRLFQSACYPGCGCAFADAAVTARSIGRYSPGHKFLPGGEKDKMCGPQHWGAVAGGPAGAASSSGDGSNDGGGISEENGRERLRVRSRLLVGKEGQGEGGKKGVGSGGGEGVGGRVDASPGWILRHFACSGATSQKGRFMGNLVEGYYGNTLAEITYKDKD